MAKAQTATKKKAKKSIPHGRAFIKASFNNTIITIADRNGNVVGQSSSGETYSGSRKHTAFAAQEAGSRAAIIAKERCNMESVDVEVKGPGPGRESAIRAFNAAGLKVGAITDTTPIAHNGCRPPKRRRV